MQYWSKEDHCQTSQLYKHQNIRSTQYAPANKEPAVYIRSELRGDQDAKPPEHYGYVLSTIGLVMKRLRADTYLE